MERRKWYRSAVLKVFEAVPVETPTLAEFRLRKSGSFSQRLFDGVWVKGDLRFGDSFRKGELAMFLGSFEKEILGNFQQEN